MIKIKYDKKPSSVLMLALITGFSIGSGLALLWTSNRANRNRQKLKRKVVGLNEDIEKEAVESSNAESIHHQSLAKDNLVTMHAIPSNEQKAQVNSKAASMVHHLKHSKKEHKDRPEPM